MELVDGMDSPGIARRKAMIVEITACYNADPDILFRSALRFSEMAEAMAGMATYSGFPDSDTACEGDTVTIDVTFWRMFKQVGHTIFIERLDPEARIIQSRESGNGIRQWDHTLSIQQDGALAVWKDVIVIDAGWRTPFIARFAAYIYARRHRHRKPISITRQLSCT
jgi:hypothetical protein